MATDRRTPPKRRHHDRPGPQAQQAKGGQQPPNDPSGYSAPSHLAGLFEDANYTSGRGTFGFTQDVMP